MSRELVVVLGMHRSGTSVLTKGVAELGYYVGETIPASDDNKKGFFENADIIKLNDEILNELYLDWMTCDITQLNRCKAFLPLLTEKYTDRAIEILETLFKNSNKCVIKDPRVSVLMPFWEYVFNKLNIEYRYVLAVRTPAEVSKSFVSRKNGTYNEGIKLWLYYNTLILRNLRNRVFVINYKNLLSKTSEVMNTLSDWLNVDKKEYESCINEFCETFVEKELNHQGGKVEVYPELIDKMYSFLNQDFLNFIDIKNFIEQYGIDIDKYLENETKCFTGQFAQLFVDTGNGFTDGQSIRIELNDTHEQCVTFNLSKYGEVKNLRFDPIDVESIVFIKSIINKDLNRSLNANVYNTNAILKNDSLHFFPNDGQIYINGINNIINEIEIKFECSQMDKISAKLCMKVEYDNLLENLIEQNKQILEDKDTHITNIENIVKDKDVHIFNIENVIKEKDGHIFNIENLLREKEQVLIEKENIITTRGELITKLIDDVERNIKQNQELIAINLGLTVGVARRREKVKYILKYPLRCAKKTVGFFIHPRATIQFYSDINFVKKIGMLDKNFYIGTSKDYKIHSFNYAEHFVRHGWLRGLKPNPSFDKDVTVFMYSDEYYNLKDMYKTIKKSKLFNESYYKTQNPDIPKDKDLIRHYVEFGYLENRNPSQYFNTEYYLTNNSDIEAVGINPLYHYIKRGFYEGRSCNPNQTDIGIFRKLKIKKYRLKNSSQDLSVGNVARYIKKHGLSASIAKTKSVLSSTSDAGSVYIYNEPTLTEDIKHEISKFSLKPKISIVMPVYNVDSKWLDLAIKSIENQWYENWEICLVDDCSTNKNTIKFLKNINSEKIKVKFLEKNLNISGATNAGLEMCTGEYIGLMDNDDEITVDALYEMVKKINEGFTFIYSDEDKLDLNGGYCDPHFKPDLSRDMLNSQNYISHFTVTKKEYFVKVEGFTVGLEGSQDYDLYLKIFDMCKPKVCHIPKVLYHWRKIAGSTASEFTEKSYAQDAGMIALQNSLDRQGVLAKASNGGRPGTYRVDYDIIGEPLVSIIIPFKDGKSLLTTCVESILNISTYKNFEIIGISNNSTLEETFEEMERLKELDNRVKFFEYNVPFNYSDINNHAIRNHSKGEYVVLLNNDIEILTENWIELMLGFAQRENTGAVGAKLYYPNDTIQHAGVIIGIGGVAGHSHKYFNKDDNGYFSRLNIIQNLSAVTAAFLMVSRVKFDEIDGLNSNELKIAFNDVDFCLRLQEEGYVNVFTPYVEAYHYESISRGAEDSPEKVARFNSEVNYMLKRHKDIIEDGDPYYNENLTLTRENFGLK